MKIELRKLKRLIKEEAEKIINESVKINTSVLEKSLTRDRLGKYRKCQQPGFVGLERNCMGETVAKLQGAINQYFLDKEQVSDMISVDGIYGESTAGALGYIVTMTSEDGNTPRLVNSVTPVVDRELAKIDKAGEAIAAVSNSINSISRMTATPEKSSAQKRAREAGEDLLGVDLSRAKDYMPASD